MRTEKINSPGADHTPNTTRGLISHQTVQAGGRRVQQLGAEIFSKLSAIVKTIHNLLQSIPKYG